MNREFLDAIEANPIIAAVKDEQGLANCLRREELTVIFILYGDIRSIGNIVERIHQAGKIAMVHIDLVTGLIQKRFLSIIFVRMFMQMELFPQKHQ